MEPALASRLSGLLYGNVLHRNSDDAGFRYHYELLVEDRLPLSTLITKFFSSDEFAEKFVVNQTPNELIHNLLLSFFGTQSAATRDRGAWRSRLVHEGLDATIAALVADARFNDKHGMTGVPRYTENATEPARARGRAT